MDMISIFVLVGIAVALIAYSAMPSKDNDKDAVKRRLEGRKSETEANDLRKRAKAAATEKFVKRAQPMLTRIIMPVSADEQNELKAKLIQAGYRGPQTQTVFLASKTACLVLFGILGVVGASVMGYDIRGALGALAFAGGVGFVAPGFWLSSVIKGRQDKIRRGLPDVLDLLVVSVESGLALDAALKRVGDEMAKVHPDLSEEVRIATMEGQMGIPRGEALNNMAQRVGIDEVRALISVITQAERFGTSVSKALRNQGVALRTKRRQEAEERAQKTAVKLMIPLVMFIFPAMGIVLAGPAAINLAEAFAK